MIKTHPQLKKKISNLEITVKDNTEFNHVDSVLGPKGIIIDNILNLQKEQVMNINDLPFINRYTNYNNWLKFMNDLNIVLEPYGNKEVKVLRNDGEVLQMIATTAENIEDERHEDVKESMLMLDGECKFTIAGNESLLKKGDYVEIPVNAIHSLSLISPKVTVVLQKIKYQ